jgi:hypothetical protein
MLTHMLPHMHRLLGAVSDAAHASMVSKLLDEYEAKDQLQQQIEAITKLEVCMRCVCARVCDAGGPGVRCHVPCWRARARA